MHVPVLLAMAADGMGDRVALGPIDGGCSMAELAERAKGGGWLAAKPGDKVVLIDVNSQVVPVARFGASIARKPFVRINYRLTDDQLRAIVAHTRDRG